MKKLRFVPIVALLLCLLSATALAAETTTPLEPTASGGKTYTVTYDAGAAGANKQYVILILKSGATPAALDVNSILYIDQAAADATGKVEFKNFQMMRNTSAEVYIGGETLTSPAHPHTITVRGVSVSGKVAFDGTARMPNVTLQTAVGEEVGVTQTAANGDYTFDSVPEAKEYRLVVTRVGHLTYTKTGVSVADGVAFPQINISQCAGDVDGNGAINGYDLQAVLGEFNATGSGITVPGTDFDANDAVNGYDLQNLLGNFNKINISE